MERVKDELKAAIRQKKRSQRWLEGKLGWGRGYISQIFTSRIELKVEHVFSLLKVLEVDPGQFFLALYPVAGETGDPEDLIRGGVVQGLATAVQEHDSLLRELQERLAAIERDKGAGAEPHDAPVPRRTAR